MGFSASVMGYFRLRNRQNNPYSRIRQNNLRLEALALSLSTHESMCVSSCLSIIPARNVLRLMASWSRSLSSSFISSPLFYTKFGACQVRKIYEAVHCGTTRFQNACCPLSSTPVAQIPTQTCSICDMRCGLASIEGGLWLGSCCYLLAM